MNTLPSLDICAKALASFIGGEVDYWPDFDRKDIKTKRLIVVPSMVERINLSRSSQQVDYIFQIGMLQLVKSEDVLPLLIEQVQTLGKALLGFVHESLHAVSVAYDPLYSAELLRERRQFTGIIRLTMRGIE